MRGSWIAGLAMVFAGCTHAPEFVHEKPELDAVAPVLTRNVSIALTSGPETDPWLERRVLEALRLSSDAVFVRRGAGPAEYSVELHVKRRATSRGTNFFVCWPGFIVFAPAWHGLEWPYRVNTLAVVKRADGGMVVRVERSDLYTAYFTSDAYGVGAGFGWLPPLYSVPAFVTGSVAAFAPEEGSLHHHFLVLESEEWARRVAADILSAVVHEPEARPEPSRF